MATDKKTYPNQAALEAHQFRKGQSGNPKGRPKNRVPTQVQGLLHSIGYTAKYWAMSKEEVSDWEQALLTLPKENIEQIAKTDNPQTPMYAQALARAILSDYKQGKMFAVDRLRDRQFGTVTAKADITTNGKDIPKPSEPLTIQVIDTREKVIIEQPK